jgi:hypothetical protein
MAKPATSATKSPPIKYSRVKISTGELRSHTAEILAPIKADIGAAEWTFHGNTQAGIFSPQVSGPVFKMLEVGSFKSDAMKIAFDRTLTKFNDGNEHPLIDLVDALMDEFKMHKFVQEAGYVHKGK